jgi:hypothetical protein
MRFTFSLLRYRRNSCFSPVTSGEEKYKIPCLVWAEAQGSSHAHSELSPHIIGLIASLFND